MFMIKRLIVNADDFALTSDISRAIIESFQNGVVTSTTILANCDAKLLEEAIELSKQNPDLGIGAHLVLTTRKPILKEHKTLVDVFGNFKYITGSFDETIDVEEVYLEWKAQLDRLKAHFNLTHIDSHHHVHMSPKLHSIARRLSKEYKLPLRSRTDNFPFGIKTALGFQGENATVEYLKSVIESEKGLLEIMVHPGYENDIFLEEISDYNTERYTELKVLCSDEIKTFLEENEIELVNYSFIHLK